MPVADWGTVQVGRLVLREGFTLTAALNGTSGDRTLTLTGEESCPPLTVAQLQQRGEDILGLQGRFVPIVFTNKVDHNGWYQITDVNTDVTNWTNEVLKFGWQISAVRVAAEQAAEIISSFSPVARANVYGLAGERWHAPNAQSYAYTAVPLGTGISGAIARASADGPAMTVYRGLPATSTSVMWGSSLASYGSGRARILVAGVERVAEDVAISASAANWELNNGIIRVTPGSGSTINVAVWAGAWQGVDWNASITASGSTPITTWNSAAIVRNDYEMVTIRLTGNRNLGRVQLDLSLRRGSRFVETVLKVNTAATLAWYRPTTEPGTAPASAGYVSATADDAAGNRYVIGAAKAFTPNTAVGGLYGSAVRTLSAMIGSVAAGGSATAGNTAADLMAQYLIAYSETVTAVRR